MTAEKDTENIGRWARFPGRKKMFFFRWSAEASNISSRFLMFVDHKFQKQLVCCQSQYSLSPRVYFTVFDLESICNRTGHLDMYINQLSTRYIKPIPHSIISDNLRKICLIWHFKHDDFMDIKYIKKLLSKSVTLRQSGWHKPLSISME